MAIKKKFVQLLLAILLVFLTGSIGYYVLFRGDHTFIDCVYMTVISLTSVGYGEAITVSGNVPAQIFTMALIIFGMSIILYGLSSMTALLIEGELSGALRKSRMKKQIQRLKGHYIVCGGDETGRHLLEELRLCRKQAVLIEQDEYHIAQCRANDDNLLIIEGDPTDDANLIAAGAGAAHGILITLPSDKDNLYVTMSARMVNKELRIVSRISDQRLAAKMKKAGADRVVLHNAIGALRMASEMIRPTVVNFLDTMLRAETGPVRIHEITIPSHSPISGKKISESGFKDRYDLLILGARDASGKMTFNPSPETLLEKGATLIVMGEVEKIEKATRSL